MNKKQLKQRVKDLESEVRLEAAVNKANATIIDSLSRRASERDASLDTALNELETLERHCQLLNDGMLEVVNHTLKGIEAADRVIARHPREDHVYDHVRQIKAIAIKRTLNRTMAFLVDLAHRHEALDLEATIVVLEEAAQ